MNTPTLDQDPALALDIKAKRQILFAVMLGIFLAALDQTVVGTALPRIVSDLGGNELYTWVVTMYLLTSTITVPFYGKLSDMYGRRPLLLFGIGLFLVGSALSGLSQTMWQLILFRGIQGAGAGALFPVAMAVIGDMFTPVERGKYQGVFGAVFGLSSLIGPALGGFLTDNISWHWVFYVNLPVGLISMYVIWRLLPAPRQLTATRDLDLLGAAVFIVSIGFLLVGLTNKQFGDWASTDVGGFILIGLVFGAVFLFVESRATEPIVPLDLWRDRTYAATLAAAFFTSFGFFGAIIFLPRWFQFVQGVSATESGYQSLALLLGLILTAILSGQVISRTGRYKPVILASLATVVLGLYLMSHLEADTPVTTLWVWMFITGIGLGPTMAAFTIVVQTVVPFDKLGVATSNLSFFRQIGGSVGLAVIGTVFGVRLSEEIPNQLTASGVPPQIIDGVARGGPGAMDALVGVGQDLSTLLLASMPPQAQPLVAPYVSVIVDAIHQAFSLAVASTFACGIITTAIAFGAALLMKELPLRRGPVRPPEKP